MSFATRLVNNRSSGMAGYLTAALTGWPIFAAAGLAAAACVFHRMLASSHEGWSDVRLVRSLALTSGAPLYSSASDGVLFDIIYGPVSLPFYLPAALLGEPKWALPAGVLISVVLGFGVAAWILWSKEMNGAADFPMRLLAVGLAFFHLYHATSESGVWNIHVDAPAVALCALAVFFALLHDGNDGWSLYLAASGVLAGLAPWAKQSAAPLIIVLAGYFWVVGKRRSAIRFAGLSFLTAAAAGGLFAARFGFSEMYLSMFQVPLHQEYRWSQLLYDGPALRDLLDTAAVAGMAVLIWSLGRDRADSTGSPAFGPGLDNRAWLLCAAVALALLPANLIARVKTGGSYNNYGYTDYFLMLAALLAMLRLSAGYSVRSRPAARAGIRLALGILLAVQALRSIPDAVRLPFELPNFSRDNPSQAVFEYDRRHPGSVYFPWQPYAVYRAEGKFFHAGYPVSDRARAGMPLSEEHFRRYLPSGMKYAAFTPGADRDILSRLPEFRCRIELKELPGWDVYTRCADGPGSARPAE